MGERKQRRGAVGALGIAGLLTIVGAAAVARAQSAPAGVPTREQLQLPVPSTPDTRGRLRIRNEVERSPCPLDNQAYANVRLRVNGVVLADLGPVAEDEVTDSYREYIGTEQPIGVVCRIRDAVATRLRAKGYIAAVEVPVQRIEDGVVRLQVLYGRVTAVRIIGEVGGNRRLLEAYLGKLSDGALFNRHRAERLLLLARDLPGYDVQLTLKPAGTGAGNLIAEVRVKRTPVIVDVNGSNFSARTSGRYGGQVRATLNGLLGLGDQTTLSAYSTAQVREQQIYQLGEDLRLGGQGLRVGGRLTYAVTRPDLGDGIPPVRAHTFLANAEVGYPIVRRQAGNLRLNGGLDILNQNVRFAGLPLSRDRLRVAYLRLDADAIDLAGRGPGGSIGWRAQGTLEIRHGLSIFGASPDCSDRPARCAVAGFVPPSIAIGDPEATVVRATAAIDWHPLKPLVIGIAPRAQIASAPLLAYEQISLGNFTAGRGFDPGTLTGDDGVGIQFELRKTPIPLTRDGRFDAQPYLFADNGWIWRRRSGLGAQRLSSVGGGARIGLGRFGRVDASLAVPVSTVRGERGRRSPLFLLTYSAILFPARSQ